MRSPAATVTRIALGVVLLALAWRAADVLQAALSAVGFTLNLDYGEGIVLQQALLVTGPRAYGDIAQYPFIVFHYPPGYLLAVHALASLGLDLVGAARSLSIAATLAMATAIGAIVHTALGGGRAGRAALFGAAVGALALFAFSPVPHWMPLARVDMLAIAFTLSGLALAIHAPDRPWLTLGAALLFSLAVYTRQTTLAAPLAATLMLLFASPRAALRLIAAGLAISLLALAAAMLLTEGGFLRHLLLYNINRYGQQGLWMTYRFAIGHAVPIGIALVAALGLAWTLLRPGWRALRQALRTRTETRATTAVLLYLAISTPLLALALKSGSSVNYFLEWICGCAMVIGILSGRAAAALRDGTARRAPVAAAAVLAAGLLVLHLARLPDPRHGVLSHPAYAPRFMHALVELVRSSPKPVLSDDMVLLLRAGKEVPWEPAIFAELASLGRWDEARLVEMIRAGRFGLAVTIGDRGDLMFDSRYNPPVAAALDAAFPRRIRHAWLVIRLPEGSDWTPPP
ncbi:hypothetical protein DFH01_05120 [Falsiroseomonas bella]|uniref:Glycosyltransferase RgtA/B/C/D-like domain-containing protein n=1 Tax=Falsiroseomonas bella TaxID=2184016 RepID=A0A317FHT7_9PROT|nr:hypothetical protein [Falsiroseomonas bella]PWS38651.1 hypothetical protein DFH01_05120 [Falsiroseomonas bella]